MMASVLIFVFGLKIISDIHVCNNLLRLEFDLKYFVHYSDPTSFLQKKMSAAIEPRHDSFQGGPSYGTPRGQDLVQTEGTGIDYKLNRYVGMYM